MFSCLGLGFVVGNVLGLGLGLVLELGFERGLVLALIFVLVLKRLTSPNSELKGTQNSSLLTNLKI